ncbi:hypothetical protein [Pediococcus argentinicus]|uniref:Uncharacterized protein n=1 Tax=Pediococcus argentinicus TaxID=480391 RepID=A0A0R2N4V9_9LACO|nr:hypothetical protein [Pediococcus argentinicus]KRO20628.1 hypothetical protein IV88_GL001575 [Pediococcus argentinicus]NKZ23176.1 hypothetical protein [Pediococcus argentinicus]GEP20382.1 hypothetical protein LSA03_17660 [Pediococcus argentinicus]
MFNFSLSLLFFWMKGSASVTADQVKVQFSNLLFGFIPTGKNDNSAPLNDVSDVKVSSKVAAWPLTIGLILIALGIWGFTARSIILGIIGLIVGILIGLTAFQSTLSFVKTGPDVLIAVPFYEKSTLEQIKALIEKLQEESRPKTDASQVLEDL